MFINIAMYIYVPSVFNAKIILKWEGCDNLVHLVLKLPVSNSGKNEIVSLILF